MDHQDGLAARFEEHRPHLRRVAFRMLGSAPEAEDAVQEAWLRLSRSDSSNVENLGGWLTTVVARICLDQLRSRQSRREESLGDHLPGLASEPADGGDAEQQLMLADSVGVALIVVLETLEPAERLAFVLHDMFDVPFEQIGSIVNRSPAAARQLASRARRRVRGASNGLEVNRARQREVVDAFLAASRGGDFNALVALLHPDVVLRADAVTVQMGAAAEVRGADAVARTLSGRAQAAQPALIAGAVGMVWAPGGRTRVAFRFAIAEGKVRSIDMLADADLIGRLDVVMLDP